MCLKFPTIPIYGAGEILKFWHPLKMMTIMKRAVKFQQSFYELHDNNMIMAPITKYFSYLVTTLKITKTSPMYSLPFFAFSKSSIEIVATDSRCFFDMSTKDSEIDIE